MSGLVGKRAPGFIVKAVIKDTIVDNFTLDSYRGRNVLFFSIRSISPLYAPLSCMHSKSDWGILESVTQKWWVVPWTALIRIMRG